MRKKSVAALDKKWRSASAKVARARAAWGKAQRANVIKRSAATSRSEASKREALDKALRNEREAFEALVSARADAILNG